MNSSKVAAIFATVMFAFATTLFVVAATTGGIYRFIASLFALIFIRNGLVVTVCLYLLKNRCRIEGGAADKATGSGSNRTRTDRTDARLDRTEVDNVIYLHRRMPHGNDGGQVGPVANDDGSSAFRFQRLRKRLQRRFQGLIKIKP